MLRWNKTILFNVNGDYLEIWCVLSATQYIYIYTHRVIQEESARLREMIMCDSKQKSSYEHGSNFERLRSYDRLKLTIEGNDY